MSVRACGDGLAAPRGLGRSISSCGTAQVKPNYLSGFDSVGMARGAAPSYLPPAHGGAALSTDHGRTQHDWRMAYPETLKSATVCIWPKIEPIKAWSRTRIGPVSPSNGLIAISNRFCTMPCLHLYQRIYE